MSRNSPKKAVHLTSVHNVFDTRIFQKECQSLQKSGYEVVLIGPHTCEETVSGVRIIPVEPSRGRVSRVCKVARSVVLRALRENGDIYHLHDPELLLWAYLLKKTGAVVVFDMHEDLPQQVKSKVWIPKILRPFLSFFLLWFEKFSLRNLPVVMAEKSYSKSRPWIGDSVDILNYPHIYWLADLGQKKLRSGNPRVGYIGAVTKERGSISMINAVGELTRMGLDVEFECIGPIASTHRKIIMDRMRALGLTKVSLPGYLSQAKGWARMATCQVGLALLDPIPNYIESYPTKMFEYMGLGLPVIVSDFPLYREIIERFQCGFAVDPHDTSAVVEKLTYLLKNPDVAVKMGHRGKVAALNEYNWKTEEIKLVEFYNRLLNQAGGSKYIGMQGHAD